MANSPVDPERPRDASAFDQRDGYSGQDYTLGRKQDEGARASEPRSPRPAQDRDLPPDDGHRATVDPDTGEVRGSGAGIGGGNPGEDFDDATPSGNTYPLTGGEGTDKVPGDLGPQQRDETSYL